MLNVRGVARGLYARALYLDICYRFIIQMKNGLNVTVVEKRCSKDP